MLENYNFGIFIYIRNQISYEKINKPQGNKEAAYATQGVAESI